MTVNDDYSQQGVYPPQETYPQREIYLIIDPQCFRQQTLEMAFLLAERLQAGIFAQVMSNVLLRQVARLPFTTEILMSSGEERELHHQVVEDVEARKAAVIRRFLEQGADLRRVSIRLEQTTDNLSLQLALEKRQDLFLPPARKPVRQQGADRGIRAVNWVYDNCVSAERCLKLLKELIGAGLTRQVNLFANKPVPQQIISSLTDSGARVCWVSSARGEALLDRLQSGSDVDLVILPASFSAQIGDARLRDLNRQCSAPILVIG